MPFQGIHHHTLDSKSRLTVPSKARALLAGGATLSMGIEDPCLQLWPADKYEELVKEAIGSLNPFGTEARELKRYLNAMAEAMEIDSGGRISVAPRFVAHSSIAKDVTVVGAGDCLELWHPETWTRHSTDLAGRAADHIKSLGHPA